MRAARITGIFHLWLFVQARQPVIKNPDAFGNEGCTCSSNRYITHMQNVRMFGEKSAFEFMGLKKPPREPF